MLQKAFGKRVMTHVILMAREEANLLRERAPQLALLREGMGQMGVSGGVMGCSGGGMEMDSKGRDISPGGYTAWFQPRQSSRTSGRYSAPKH